MENGKLRESYAAHRQAYKNFSWIYKLGELILNLSARKIPQTPPAASLTSTRCRRPICEKVNNPKINEMEMILGLIDKSFARGRITKKRSLPETGS